MNLLIPLDRRVRPAQRLKGGYTVQSVLHVALDLDHADAVTWVNAHDRRWVRAQEAYLLKAEVPVHEVDPALALLCHYRYRDRWHGTTVQQADVNVSTTPRMLAPSGQQRAADERGYTAGADVLDAGECVDIADLGAVWVNGSTARHQTACTDRVEAAREVRAAWDTETRIVAARQAARLNNIDVRDEVRLLRLFIKEGRSERSTSTQLAKLEKRAYREAA